MDTDYKVGELIYDAHIYDGLNTFLSDLQFYKKWLPTNMVNTSTGSVNRLVPKSVAFARKTGYSGANDQGVIAAQNDVGIIELEDGRRVAYAIFLTDSTLGTDAGYDILAQIGKAIWKAYER